MPDDDLTQLDDRALMAAVRQGSRDSFALLYSRHVDAAAGYARRLVRQSADEHDIVAEAFIRVYAILARGLGPQDSFRPYLLRAVRNAAYDRTRAERRLELTDEVTVLEGVVPFRDTAVEGVDRGAVVQAFRELPPRWQTVLWLTIVDECPVEDAAGRLGVSPNSLTSLAYRAREGLRQAYLRVVLGSGVNAVCEHMTDALVRHIRSLGSVSERQAVDEHLRGCVCCRTRLDEVAETDAQLWGRTRTKRRVVRPAGRRTRSAAVTKLKPLPTSAAVAPYGVPA